ncbi:phospho-sugar mutase [Oscillospiraceae bacterium OttesenSCG-928-F05]|nr:phospho-sugar mutase [Oscillospiraceae bacterium OttesenSCG-928-F05]
MENYQKWLNSPALDEEDRTALLALVGDEEEIESRFFAPLTFGTAGLRGVMAPGLHRMNVYVIRQTTEAIARLIHEEGAAEKGVAIAYDCRHNSARFAREAACVFAGHGIPVRLFDALRPTPELSFAIRHYGCVAGINITASHNPKAYNGYKAYWSDGAQFPPEQAARVMALMETIDLPGPVKTMDYDQAVAEGKILLLGAETDELFLSAVLSQSVDKAPVARVAENFSLVFTPFHGAGHKLVPEALRRLGFKHIHCVPEQMVIDGDFPTVKSPNPEEAAGFAMGIALAEEKGSGLIIATDPDSDRVGIAVRDDSGAYITLSGNQTGALLCDYIIRARKARGTLPPEPYAIKTIVTTELTRAICEAHDVAIYDTFTGFKFIAEKMNACEAAGEHCIFTYEESYGYMIGTHARDKDAVVASMLIAEMAAWYADKGMTLSHALRALYETYGAYAEKTINAIMPGVSGLADMKALMDTLRASPPAEIGGLLVEQMRDYLSGTIARPGGEPVGETHIRDSNVLYFDLAGGTKFIARPSGTEPKIKFYILARGRDMDEAEAHVRALDSYVKTLVPQK